MDYKIELTKLYNTMLTIETKGEHTLTMSDCLRFVKQLINYEPPKEEVSVDEERKES